MGGRGSFSSTAALATDLQRQIASLDARIADVDARIGQRPEYTRTLADFEPGGLFEWADAMREAGRPGLVAERKRLQRQLAEISGGRQLVWRL